VITTTVRIETTITIETSESESERTDPGVITAPAPHAFNSEPEFAAWLNAHPGIWPGGQGASLYANNAGYWVAYSDPAFGLSDVYEIAVCCEDEQHAEHVAGLVGYFVQGPFAGEFSASGAMTPEDPALRYRLFCFYVDFTKSRRDDVYDVLPSLWEMLREGSPVRKTDRAGAGTRGTRKHEGLGGNFWLAFR
jgi:hypothetical protein